MAGGRDRGGLTARLLARQSGTFKRRNRAENVDTMKAAFATNGFQQEEREQTLFQETARARTVGFLSIAFRAVKVPETTTPQRGSRTRHDILPAARGLIVNPGS